LYYVITSISNIIIIYNREIKKVVELHGNLYTYGNFGTSKWSFETRLV